MTEPCTSIDDRQLDFLDRLAVPHQRHAPLGPRTWYGIGGSAQVLAAPESTEQLQTLARNCWQRQIPVRVLGSGANLLVADTVVPGIVIDMMAPAFNHFHIAGHHLIAGAGCDLFKLIPAVTREGLGGLHVLAGIPASVGGAIRMNAGGTFGEIGDSVHSVTVMENDGAIHTLTRRQITFSYRRTNIAQPIILSAEFALKAGDPSALAARFKEIFALKSKSQPMGESSAGCAFRNPPKTSDNSLAAGQLIDQAKLKQYRVGGAYVSPVHANFIVAEKNAAASDVLAVIEHVQKVVRDRFGVALQRELVVWP